MTNKKALANFFSPMGLYDWGYAKPFTSKDLFISPMESVVDNFFNEFNSLLPSSVKTSGKVSYPKTDVYKDGSDLVFESSIPFGNKDSIKVELSKNLMTIIGECVKDEDGSGKDYMIRELRRSKFIRSFIIPDEVLNNKTDMKAKYQDDGMLVIRFVDAYKVEEVEDEDGVIIIDVK